MVEVELKASPDEISELRRQFLEKYEIDGATETDGGFHPLDLYKVKHDDDWLARFLEYNDLNMKQALKQLIETCEWRQKYELNDICEENIRMDYILEGQMFARNKDLDGNLLLIFICKMYVRGSKNMDDLKRCFLYWVERSYRESNGVITCIFDMQGTSLNNVDMDYTRFMINTFKYYYPNSLNYILVYDMPWILNATFQIIKRLLPAKAVSRLKFVNSKSIRQYIDEVNMLDVWGGQDSTTFEFVPEVRKEIVLIKNGETESNNNLEKDKLNGVTNGTTHHHRHHHHHHSHRKVHFANLTPADSPMSELSNSSSFTNNDTGDMLYLSPAETILFQKTTNNEFVGNVDIRNISSKAVTYKIKTTTPDKFRVRPSSGTLLPNESVTVNVVLQKGHKIQPMIRDKFLVMAISLPDISTTTPDDIACIWKNVTANSTDVEQHRLKCALPANITTAIINSVDGEFFTDGEMSDQYGGSSSSHSNATSNNFNTARQSNSSAHLQTTISQLNDTVHRLEQHMKFNQTLQWISIFLFFLLSISIVYILKSEIQNSNSQYCIDNK